MSSKQKTLYQALKDAGCEMDSHRSDLYVEDTETARKILAEYGVRFTWFRSEPEGAIWLDVPFMFDPFWDRKLSQQAG